MQSVIVVSLSEVKVSGSEGDVLVAYSLGSCVGVALWDPGTRLGGMAHVVLPSGSARPGDDPGAETEVDPAMPGKFGDTGVRYLASRLRDMGCDLRGLRAWVAGGAHVLKGLMWPAGDIGAANVKAVLEALKALSIPAPLTDVGGDYGRTMRLYTASGRVTVSSVGRSERDI